MVKYPFATEEQRQLAEGARFILEKELAPRIEALEKGNGGKGEYPLDVQKSLASAGYYGMNIPEEWGGLNLDLTTQCLICEEMAKVDAGFAFNFYCAGSFFGFIARTGLTTAEKQVWADRHLSGDAVGTFCLTEPGAGSDAGALRTTAVKEGNEWVLNGTKCFITNGPICDCYFVVAWTDKSKGKSGGMTLFMVEKDFGVQVGNIENKMGLKLSLTSEIILDNVRVSEDHVVGEVGRGFVTAMEVLRERRVHVMSFSLGIAQAALEYSIKYSNERNAFGKRIVEHEGHGFQLADMQIRTDASRALLYEAAAMIDAGLDVGLLSSSVKSFVAENTMQTTLDAVQVFGGYGYIKDYPVEKLMRDAKIFCIFDGTTNINKMIISRSFIAPTR